MALIFLFNNAVYGVEDSIETCLRVPMRINSDRLEQTLYDFALSKSMSEEAITQLSKDIAIFTGLLNIKALGKESIPQDIAYKIAKSIALSTNRILPKDVTLEIRILKEGQLQQAPPGARASEHIIKIKWWGYVSIDDNELAVKFDDYYPTETPIEEIIVSIEGQDMKLFDFLKQSGIISNSFDAKKLSFEFGFEYAQNVTGKRILTASPLTAIELTAAGNIASAFNEKSITMGVLFKGHSHPFERNREGLIASLGDEESLEQVGHAGNPYEVIIAWIQEEQRYVLMAIEYNENESGSAISRLFGLRGRIYTKQYIDGKVIVIATHDTRRTRDRLDRIMNGRFKLFSCI